MRCDVMQTLSEEEHTPMSSLPLSSHSPSRASTSSSAGAAALAAAAGAEAPAVMRDEMK